MRKMREGGHYLGGLKAAVSDSGTQIEGYDYVHEAFAKERDNTKIGRTIILPCHIRW